MTTGGSIESVSIKGRQFAVASDSDSPTKLGGFEAEAQANGDGTARKVKVRANWSIDGLNLSVDNLLGDQDFLQDVADSNDWDDVVITYADGASRAGRGTVVGELQFNNQASTCTVTLAGPGRLELV